jgi:hypothetical protein
MEIEKAAKTIYFNLGPTNADKAAAVAKGLFAAYLITRLGQRTALPRGVSLITFVAVATPPTLQLDGQEDRVDQWLRYQGKIPLRAWLTGMTVGSVALLLPSFLRSRSLLTFALLGLHGGLLTLFTATGALQKFRLPKRE